jgi:hypothetical protein
VLVGTLRVVGNRASVGTRFVVSCLIVLLVAALLVGMYLRTTQRRNRDGSVVRYVQLAHNRRVGAVTQAQVLANLGREDQLDRDGLRRLVASINRYLGVSDTAATDSTQFVGDGLTAAGSRPVGAVHLLDGLWRALGVDAALRKVLGPRRFSTDIERVLLALVANRAIEPMSKLSAAEWAVRDCRAGVGSRRTRSDFGGRARRGVRHPAHVGSETVNPQPNESMLNLVPWVTVASRCEGLRRQCKFSGYLAASRIGALCCFEQILV